MRNKTVYALCVFISLLTAGFCGLIAGSMLAYGQTGYFLAFILSALANVYNATIGFDLYKKS